MAPRREPLHPSLDLAGSFLRLSEDGPLGQAGDTLLLPFDEVISPRVLEQAMWEFANVRMVVEKLRPGTEYTLLDIGANIGLFSLQCATAFPVEKIICLEPDHFNAGCLRYNLSRLADRTTIFEIALSDREGKQDFFRDRRNMGNYSLNTDAVRDQPHDRTTVTTVDASTWLAGNVPDSEGLIWKSDTQGYDELIVSRAPMDLWSRIDVAIMELWRIEKPDYDRAAFRRRIEDFPHRSLGGQDGTEVRDILEYLDSTDYWFKDLLLWR